MSHSESSVPGANNWRAPGRAAVFVLATSSIACLLFDFYGLCPMRLFTPYVFLPAVVVLLGAAVLDRIRADGQLWRGVMIGLAGGLLAAVSYDLFRLPSVFARQWGLDQWVPPMNLFKVFPGFGAMILGQPVEQSTYSLPAHLIGWLHHFSNGASFGVMYVAMIGDGARRHWAWAALFAMALELGMLLTPYPQVFHIAVTPHFIGVTLAAHGIFGIILGLSVREFARRRNGRRSSVADAQPLSP